MIRKQKPTACRHNHILLLVVFFALFFTSCSREPLPLTLLYHNDFHAANSPYYIRSESGDSLAVAGAAGIRGLADAVLDTAPSPLWLNAGDDCTGGIISSLTRGSSQIELARRLGYDVFCLGNHEFDHGLERAGDLRDSLGIPVLGGANLRNPEDQPFTRTHHDTTIGGVKVRIVGLLPPDLTSLTGKDKIGDLHVSDPAEAAREFIPKRNRLYLILSHMGYERDSLLATQVPEIDAIIGGHSHTVLHQPRLIGRDGRLPDSLISGAKRRIPGTLIVQAGSSGRYLGVLSLTVVNGDITDAHGRLLANDGTLATPDQTLAAWVQRMYMTLVRDLDQPIAWLAEPLIRQPREESPLGRWQADVFRTALETDIGFHNSGGLRKDLYPGPITMRDIWETNPFGNTLVVFQITSDELAAIMQYLATNPHEALQVSGLTATIDTKAKSAYDILVAGVPVDSVKSYRAVTNSFVFDHFEEFFGIEQGDRMYYDTSFLDRDILIQAAREADTLYASSKIRLTYLR